MSVVKPVRTCFPDPNDASQAYFIRNYDFAIIKWAPGKFDDTIVHGPASLDYWPALRNAGISSIDAVLPYPGYKDYLYIFSGGLYYNAKIDASGNITVHGGPTSIHAAWKTLTEAGFTTVDAVLPVPGQENQVYFFSGTRYVKIYFVPGTSEERIQYGPKEIFDEWKTLKEANFTTIDAVLPHPTAADRAYFFSGEKYCQIQFKPSSPEESFITNPHPVAEYWKSLHEARFY